LKEGRGNYTVEYIHQNPENISGNIGSGLDHISKLEYWIVLADGNINDKAKIELSFASALSGGITDPDYLNVAKFQTSQWEDAGHTGSTGNFLQGSVLSGNSDFTADYYTLASVLNLENPLPLTTIDLEIKEISDKTVFSWKFESEAPADHFDLYEESGGQSIQIAKIPAKDHLSEYSWVNNSYLRNGIHYFRIRMVDVYGNNYAGELTLFKKQNRETRLSWFSEGIGTGPQRILIQSEHPDVWKYEIISINGRSIIKGLLKLGEGITELPVSDEMISTAFYLFRASDSFGNNYALVFRKD
jgi:hypothetical protein